MLDMKAVIWLETYLQVGCERQSLFSNGRSKCICCFTSAVQNHSLFCIVNGFVVCEKRIIMVEIPRVIPVGICSHALQLWLCFSYSARKASLNWSRM